jgi:tetratricopeptide (TPR) repeat protein
MDSKNIQLQAARELHSSGQLKLAYEKYLQLIKQFPSSAELYSELGNVFSDNKNFDIAIKAYLKAIELSPHFSIAHFNLGNCYFRIQQFSDAKISFENALKIDNNFFQAFLNLGNTFLKLNDLDQSKNCFLKALNLSPLNPSPYVNLGSLHFDCREFSEAEENFRVALRLDPESTQANWNLALLLLMQGKFSEAWPHYEWRWKEGGYCHSTSRNFTQPVWLGQFPIKGKIILIHSEQGIGDTLQFVRFIQDLKKLDAEILLEVQPEVVDLLKQNQTVKKIFARGGTIPPFDAHCGLMSLPYALRLNLEGLNATEKYLQPDRIKVHKWHERLSNYDGLRVGLVWSGGLRPNQPDVLQLNERRNIPLAQFESLKIASIQWVSLQKGLPAENDYEQLRASNWQGPEILDFNEHLSDFNETAALIACLDLVISVDTSTAHLSGAMGCPTWILNRFDACWRWLIDRQDTPWYPNVTLYKQEIPGNWSHVMDQVKKDLICLRDQKLGISLISVTPQKFS